MTLRQQQLIQRPWTPENADANVTLHPERLEDPLGWKKPYRVFANSMSDLLHANVPNEFIAQVFDVMHRTPRLTYQLLTKRAQRIATIPPECFPNNLWMGVSIENSDYMFRKDLLVKHCPTPVRWISFEPLIARVGPFDDNHNLDGIQWVVVGGESGPAYREMDPDWAREIRDECVKRNIPFFFKQDSARKDNTRPWLFDRDGTAWRWHQYPDEMTPPERVDLSRQLVVAG
jgi:protein gp37